MEGINLVLLLGEVSQEPLITKSGLNGATKLSFVLSVSRTVKATNLYEKLIVIAYDKVADLAKDKVKIGTEVLIEGRLQSTQRDGYLAFAVLANKITVISQSDNTTPDKTSVFGLTD